MGFVCGLARQRVKFGGRVGVLSDMYCYLGATPHAWLGPCVGESYVIYIRGNQRDIPTQETG